jgi:hypothetical protein
MTGLHNPLTDKEIRFVADQLDRHVTITQPNSPESQSGEET